MSGEEDGQGAKTSALKRSKSKTLSWNDSVSKITYVSDGECLLDEETRSEQTPLVEESERDKDWKAKVTGNKKYAVEGIEIVTIDPNAHYFDPDDLSDDYTDSDYSDDDHESLLRNQSTSHFSDTPSAPRLKRDNVVNGNAAKRTNLNGRQGELPPEQERLLDQKQGVHHHTNLDSSDTAKVQNDNGSKTGDEFIKPPIAAPRKNIQNGLNSDSVGSDTIGPRTYMTPTENQQKQPNSIEKRYGTKPVNDGPSLPPPGSIPEVRLQPPSEYQRPPENNTVTGQPLAYHSQPAVRYIPASNQPSTETGSRVETNVDDVIAMNVPPGDHYNQQMAPTVQQPAPGQMQYPPPGVPHGQYQRLHDSPVPMMDPNNMPPQGVPPGYPMYPMGGHPQYNPYGPTPSPSELSDAMLYRRTPPDFPPGMMFGYRPGAPSVASYATARTGYSMAPSVFAPPQSAINKPNPHLMFSLIVVFVNICFGGPALACSLMSRSAIKRGQYPKAAMRGKMALILNIIGLVTAALFIIFLLAMLFSKTF